MMTPEDVYLAAISGGKLAHRVINSCNHLWELACYHTKREKCLYYQNSWWNLCLSCGFMYRDNDNQGIYLKDLQ